MDFKEWPQVHTHILQAEHNGLVTRTFRRLDPERQQAVLLAILEEAAEKGPAGVNIKQVAARAGVALGSLYQYFPDRQRMLQFAIELCVKFVTDSFNAFRPYLAQMPLADALGMYLSGGVEWSGMYTSFLRLFARAAYHGEPALTDTLVRPVATTLREMVNDILAAAQARGELRDDLDLEAAARLVHALTIACGDSQLLPYLNDYFQVTGDAVDAPRMTAAFVGLVLKGIGRRENA